MTKFSMFLEVIMLQNFQKCRRPSDNHQNISWYNYVALFIYFKGHPTLFVHSILLIDIGHVKRFKTFVYYSSTRYQPPLVSVPKWSNPFCGYPFDVFVCVILNIYVYI